MLKALAIAAALSIAPIGAADAAGFTFQFGGNDHHHHAEHHYSHYRHHHRVCGWVWHQSYRHHHHHRYRVWECWWR